MDNKDNSKNKKFVFSTKEWDRIESESNTAGEMLTSKKFEFFRTYLESLRSSMIEIVAEGRVKEVVETTSDGQYTKSIKTTKEEQLNEISGSLKLLKQIWEDLARFSKQKEEADKAIKDGLAELEAEKEK